MSLLGRATLFILSLAVGGSIALVGSGYLVNYWKMYSGTPADPLELDQSSGVVEIAGTAQPNKTPNQAPFTGTETLITEWEVGEYRSGGNDWDLLKWGDERQSFIVETDRGEVLVNPDGAQLNLVNTEEKIVVDPEESSPLSIADFLEETEALDQQHREPRYYQEKRLDPGDEVHILGPVQAGGANSPDTVDAVIGVPDDDERVAQIGEDDISTLVEKGKQDFNRFILTDDDEYAAERHQLREGIIWLAAGIVAGGLGIVAALFAPSVPPFF